MSKESVIIIGGTGQLGMELNQLLNCMSASINVTSLSRADLDVTDSVRVSSVIKDTAPSVVVNCSAYHNVEHCEKHKYTSFMTNSLGPKNLAEACDIAGSTLIHISTDYVFGGEKNSPYVETDNPSPLNTYGITKLAGEQYVKNTCEKHYIIRTSGLYGNFLCRAKGNNFVTLMMNLSQSRDEVRVVNDEFVSPTYTYDLATAITNLIRRRDQEYGVCHMSSQDSCTWYEFAQVIWNELQLNATLSMANPGEFPQKTPRPSYSVLGTSKLSGDYVLPSWKVSLPFYLRSINSTTPPTRGGDCLPPN